MKFLHEYIDECKNSPDVNQQNLAEILYRLKKQYDVFLGGEPQEAFIGFVDMYNWLGVRENKDRYNINQNLSRNLTAALMQDYLIHLIITLCKPYPKLDIFTEVRIPFGNYPIWKHGEVSFEAPSELSDIAAGYLVDDGRIVSREAPYPKQPHYRSRLMRGKSVLPLLTINSKIRISQSEFFDWFGREQLMKRGNPDCLSVQVALRKEMSFTFVEVAQAEDNFFLLGRGGETSVVPNQNELERLIIAINEHLEKKMNHQSSIVPQIDD